MYKDLTEREEDYLRGILEIQRAKGYSRIRDISEKVGVTPPSAVEMMRKLDDKMLVNYEKYGGVTLTSEGRRIARAISERHETFRRFLEILQVPKETATRDAHILEHQLHPTTILQFKRFVDFITDAPEHPRFVGRWMEMFKRYCQEKSSKEKDE
ncbi:MAG: metal-dependent transcriptional regulator [Candidatus Bathyarchaeia archaeon]